GEFTAPGPVPARGQVARDSRPEYAGQSRRPHPFRRVHEPRGQVHGRGARVDVRIFSVQVTDGSVEAQALARHELDFALYAPDSRVTGIADFRREAVQHDDLLVRVVAVESR